MASGWSPAGSRSVTSSNSGTEREYRRRAPVTSRPASAAAARRSVQISRICFSSSERSPELSTTQVATFRRSSSVACSPMRRRGVVARDTPRASSRSSRGLQRRLHDDDARVLEPPLRLHEERDVVDHHRAGRRFGDPAQELLADHGMRDRLELLAGLVIDEGDGRERGPVERSRRPGGSPARSGRRAWPASGVPGSTTSRAIASASITTAPRSASIPATVDFPAPIPPVNPTINMRPGFYGPHLRATVVRVIGA